MTTTMTTANDKARLTLKWDAAHEADLVMVKARVTRHFDATAACPYAAGRWEVVGSYRLSARADWIEAAADELTLAEGDEPTTAFIDAVKAECLAALVAAAKARGRRAR